MRMGPAVLAALCLCSCILTVTPLLNEEQVGRATAYIQQHFTKDFDYEFAYFVKFTEDECNRGLTTQVLQTALKDEDAAVMFREVDAFRIYRGHRMVACSYQKYKKGNKEYSIHAEYRLLDGATNSPISALMFEAPLASCGILYSWYSPCVSKCLLPSGTYNIINKMSTVILPQDKVFAFAEVFHEDIGHEQQVWQSWGTLNSYIPLYRCIGNNCRQCFINGVQQNQCYND
ncbi:uncharacterized protein ACNLHF_013210 [Anomaloglossus baeobatrachus]|uniref:uncharacterized protein LOC142295787 n=1 Tax=Anomaloglossus baeobatrachus TaxID=238106 RepID=UPI003F509D09